MFFRDRDGKVERTKEEEEEESEEPSLIPG
jgi:hypothetical protein